MSCDLNDLGINKIKMYMLHLKYNNNIWGFSLIKCKLKLESQGKGYYCNPYGSWESLKSFAQKDFEKNESMTAKVKKTHT